MVRDTSASSGVLTVVVHLLLAAVLVATVFPLLHVASMSVSDPEAIVGGFVTFYPNGFQLDGYRAILQSGRVVRSLLNSVRYTVVGSVLNVVMTILMAYPLSKRELPLRSLYSFLAAFTLYFGGGMVPLFILVRKLGLFDSMWALILPGAISVFNMVIMRTYFQGLPREIEESATMDGAHDVTVLVRIVLPLSKASIFTIALFYAVGHWNAYLQPVMYLKSQNRYPLQVILQQIVSANQMSQELSAMGGAAIDAERVASSMGLEATAMSEMIKYSTLVVSILPMAVVYPFVQKYFVKGVTLGSLKG